MKLTNRQINVIVDHVSAKHRAKKESALKAMRSDKKILAEAKRIHAIGQQIPDKIRDELSMSRFTLTRIIDALIAVAPPPIEKFDGQAFQRRVILKSIDAKNLADLLKQLDITDL